MRGPARRYQDTGEVLTYDEPREPSVTHYSPLAGQPDAPENYRTLTYTLTPTRAGTHLALTQDGNDSEAQAQQFSENWQAMLDTRSSQVEA